MQGLLLVCGGVTCRRVTQRYLVQPPTIQARNILRRATLHTKAYRVKERGATPRYLLHYTQGHLVQESWDVGAVYHVGVLHYAHGYVVWGCYSLHTGRSWRGGVLHKGEEGCYTKGSCVEVTQDVVAVCWYIVLRCYAKVASFWNDTYL